MEILIAISLVLAAICLGFTGWWLSQLPDSIKLQRQAMENLKKQSLKKPKR